MNVSRGISWALILPLLYVPAPAAGRMARPPEIVGPPFVQLDGRCPTRLEKPGGNGNGTAIPVKALRLGAPVRRAPMSFGTGGSVTAKFAEVERRKQAGLQYAPKTFDVAGSTQPEVYSADIAEASNRQVYQQLPLEGISQAYDANGLIFAQATSTTTGRIVSLQLTLRKPPSAKPRLRIIPVPRPDLSGCSAPQGLDVYAPAMTADQVRGLFATSDCNWYALTKCKITDRPRGHVLFVQRQGPGYVHRWVDYDILGRMHLDALARP